jgi:hypothetical protein
VFEKRFGTPLVGILLFIVPYLGVFTCNMSSLTYTARIVFAYARDHMVGSLRPRMARARGGAREGATACTACAACTACTCNAQHCTGTNTAPTWH